MGFLASVAEISFLGLPEKPWLGKEAIGCAQKSLLSTICSAKKWGVMSCFVYFLGAMVALIKW